MNLNNVNKRNTREWALFNGNSKSEQNRHKLVEKHGGYWEKKERSWFWHNPLQNTVKIIQFAKPKKPRTIFLFTHKNGTNFITDNFEGFCKQNNINSSAMHEVLTGKRKQFKGYVVTRLSTPDNAKNT
jgi:hypothetical protein